MLGGTRISQLIQPEIEPIEAPLQRIARSRSGCSRVKWSRVRSEVKEVADTYGFVVTSDRFHPERHPDQAIAHIDGVDWGSEGPYKVRFYIDETRRQVETVFEETP
jgi:hypothetical protein